MAQAAEPVHQPSYAPATLHEASNRLGVLPCQIKPVSPAFRIWGPAFPVRCTAGNNLWLHRAVYIAPAGSVLVVSVDGAYEFGYWGEILSVAAAARGLGGLVIDGCVRDGTAVAEVGFPVFSRGLCIRGTSKDAAAGGGVGDKVELDGVTVRHGDLIVGDCDGVVAIPQDRVPAVLAASQAREADEALVTRRLRAGERTIDIFGIGG